MVWMYCWSTELQASYCLSKKTSSSARLYPLKAIRKLLDFIGECINWANITQCRISDSWSWLIDQTPGKAHFCFCLLDKHSYPTIETKRSRWIQTVPSCQFAAYRARNSETSKSLWAVVVGVDNELYGQRVAAAVVLKNVSWESQYPSSI